MNTSRTLIDTSAWVVMYRHNIWSWQEAQEPLSVAVTEAILYELSGLSPGLRTLVGSLATVIPVPGGTGDESVIAAVQAGLVDALVSNDSGLLNAVRGYPVSLWRVSRKSRIIRRESPR